MGVTTTLLVGRRRGETLAANHDAQASRPWFTNRKLTSAGRWSVQQCGDTGRLQTLPFRAAHRHRDAGQFGVTSTGAAGSDRTAVFGRVPERLTAFGRDWQGGVESIDNKLRCRRQG